ncbi:MAG TPA: alpha/beta hydrolase-fold protein [Actinomycetota bacterium]|nr:alpha/beta hydrolase-fold protein [Actinomycetota bacterium]
MKRDEVGLWAPQFGTEGHVISYGHYGRPLLVFPSEQGHRMDYEDRGMIAAMGQLIEDGRLRVYCIDSFDAGSWSRNDIPLEERARLHGSYEDWVLNQVVPWIFDSLGSPQDIIATGCSFGAYHAANFALKRADLFPLAICQSGVYDVATVGWGDPGDATYFNNPMAYVSHLHGDHLEWLRSRVNLLLICGQGQWEDTTGALESTKAFAGLLGSKGIRHELDLWGYDVPHDWPSWRAQLGHHMPRFC